MTSFGQEFYASTVHCDRLIATNSVTTQIFSMNIPIVTVEPITLDQTDIKDFSQPNIFAAYITIPSTVTQGKLFVPQHVFGPSPFDPVYPIGYTPFSDPVSAGDDFYFHLTIHTHPATARRYIQFNRVGTFTGIGETYGIMQFARMTRII
jgi:hypothetical protein